MPFRTQLEKLEHAKMFARGAHSAVGQVRKYTGVPYYTHPEAVVLILLDAKDVTDEMYMAAYLHDVVEDANVKLTTILEIFGYEVCVLTCANCHNHYHSPGW